jgi:hypothetical protein
MRAIAYYRAAAFLPVALPAILVAADIALTRAFGVSLRAGRVGTLLIGSLAVAGVPYVIFTFAALLVLRRQPPTAYRRAALIAPLAFIPFLGVVVFGLSLWSSNLPLIEELKGLPADLGYLALLVLPLGYSYVAVVLLAARTLSRAGLLEHA